MAKRDVATFCRVCEPACGLVATVEDGRLIQLAGDAEHPVTRGYACHKGLAGVDIHVDADRVNHPLARSAPGEFRRVGWDEALSSIGDRLRAIVSESGPDAVASYVGNPSGFNALARPAFDTFLRHLGVDRTFGSVTQDCANKFAGSTAIFGSRTIHPIPDIERTDYLLILGENPAVSHMSFLAIADPMAVLRAAKRRGARILFVDPRRHESIGDSVGDHVAIRPDTDLYLLAAMLCEIDATVGFDSASARHGRGIEELRRFVRRSPPERASAITGIPADTIRGLARDFATASSASIHMSTGVNMGRQGTLCYWLVHMLALVTGNLDREGGLVLSEGFYLNAKSGRARFEDGFRKTTHGWLRRGAMPGTLLADEILDPERPIRALFVLAGNPILSMAGEEGIRKAFETLDLVVSVDIYRNATGEQSDFVLPATDMFERQDVNLNSLGLQHKPYVQWTDRVVEPLHERREEWWIFAKLSQELGLPSVLDGGSEELHDRLWGKVAHMLQGRGHSFDELVESGRGITYGELRPGRFFDEHIQTEDRRVDCFPAAFESAIERAERICCELESGSADGDLLLVTRRDRYMHNSWYANLSSLKPSHHDRVFVYIHPDDARRLALAEGEDARVSNRYGEIVAQVRLDPALMPGVVAVPHGWGNRDTPGMRVAHAHPGENVNRVLPTGPESYEPLSSQSHMTGIPVSVGGIGG
ncbi:MAG: molybdopterin-dependent oxidoreductase [Acidobacteriota bacterium]|nr:molybdopterin-dependent oxidoreductase [Acidobacteriota bacterium]